ncbi:uncharacterized protein LOC120329066 [Styela clava]
MQRSVRPKSAKGKARPTPPSRPRQHQTQEPTSSSTSEQNHSYGRRGYSLRRSGPPNSSYRNASSRPSKSSQKPEEDTNSEGPDPSQFPEVSRPVSSLSKYSILPMIPKTPDHSDFRVISPTESVVELDLLSSFAQQMILDSATANLNKSDSSVSDFKQETNSSHSASKMKRTAASNGTGKQNNINNQDSPQHKKFRSSLMTTKSVFPPRTARAKNTGQGDRKNGAETEPAAGEERLRLALKLPDGKRVERYFAPTSTINDVMNFAKTKMKAPIRRCVVYSMLQVPKEKLKNWKRTLKDLGLTDRTMLYIDEE